MKKNISLFHLADLDIGWLAKKLNGFFLFEIISIITLSMIKCISNNESSIKTENFKYSISIVQIPSKVKDKVVNFNKINRNSPDQQRLLSESSNSQLDLIGGFEEIKKRLKCIFEWPITRPEAFIKLGIRPFRGVLLHGPPGCSKTSLIKAIASSLNINLFSLDSSTVYSQYFGESEKIVRDIFESARQAAPSIVFIDEIDAIIGSRSQSESSSYVSGSPSLQNSIIATFLNEMDGINTISHSGVVVVGATNRLFALDNAIMRPGRFDFIINVPLPEANDRLMIMRLATRYYKIDPDVNMELISSTLTKNFSGADIVSMCREAILAAITDNIHNPIISMHHMEAAAETVSRKCSSKKTTLL